MLVDTAVDMAADMAEEGISGFPERELHVR